MATADDIAKEEDEENRRNTMASGETTTAHAHHIRRKKKKKILPGSAVILRLPPPPPPASGCASCSNCYLGHSCCHQPLPEFPSKSHDCPPTPPPHLQPQTKKVNNIELQNVYLVDNDLNSKDPCRKSSSMSPQYWLPRLPKRHRRKAVVCLIGGLCFLFGLAVPFLFGKSLSGAQGNPRSRTRPSGAHLDDYKLDAVLSDLFISVKTTKKYHHPRLVILLETWVTLVKSQTWFFTDSEDAEVSRKTNGHLINTNCSDSHSRTALSCKMGAEFDFFLRSYKSWWCHFDDDNYVHVARLAQMLKSHDAGMPVYLGKPSTPKPMEIFDLKAPQNTSHFWFATGGAGFCVSRTMALKMAPFAANGKFVETGEHFWFPDDVTLGYIIEHLLAERLTVVPELHSHLEPMSRIALDEMDEQISFSYIKYNGVANVISLPGPFSKEVDSTRFYSLHCRLYTAPYCPDEVTK